MTPFRLAVALAACLVAACACSRTDDKAAAPAAGAAGKPKEAEAAAAAGGVRRAMRPGLWKTTAVTPTGEQTSTQCVGEDYDPALAAAKAAPCGDPQITPVIDGFTIELACRKDKLAYSLAGLVKGDFQTRMTNEMEMTVQGFGASKRLKLSSESVYVGPCAGGGDSATPASKPAA